MELVPKRGDVDGDGQAETGAPTLQMLLLSLPAVTNEGICHTPLPRPLRSAACQTWTALTTVYLIVPPRPFLSALTAYYGAPARPPKVQGWRRLPSTTPGGPSSALFLQGPTGLIRHQSSVLALQRKNKMAALESLPRRQGNTARCLHIPCNSS
ncbi:hypothetical protein SKAU_G00006060 [Synaphobranchus kaupii]|uniref:Uncharacterized protein n=1 Tax=Synaphobranchus kaupii TaxID=118154 RepID=A0A9Q1JBP7_SYNKA|nr:hypothetical protein SKAU_G00006060 [Synaphobranchus kaupii]